MEEAEIQRYVAALVDLSPMSGEEASDEALEAVPKPFKPSKRVILGWLPASKEEHR
jgi:hypothetical protein